MECILYFLFSLNTYYQPKYYYTFKVLKILVSFLVLPYTGLCSVQCNIFWLACYEVEIERKPTLKIA